MPKVSVIIPCYNQGAYLEEAVESVLAQTFQDFEILVVDDGSTDAETVKMLKDSAWPKTRVIRTENQGLSAARNTGIREAQGVYILPLDADDKIGKGYLEDAVRILDRHSEIGIVYCEASYFGVKGGRWDLPEYSLDKILNHNVIFCTALFRKADWEAVGGYNVNMVYGWEDWDFWLSLIHRGRKVYRIPKIYFYYRLREVFDGPYHGRGAELLHEASCLPESSGSLPAHGRYPDPFPCGGTLPGYRSGIQSSTRSSEKSFLRINRSSSLTSAITAEYGNAVSIPSLGSTGHRFDLESGNTAVSILSMPRHPFTSRGSV